MQRQDAERERQRIAAEYRYRDCAPSRSRFIRRLGFRPRSRRAILASSSCFLQLVIRRL